MKKKIGIIFGGRSGEHDISIRSARAVIEKIDRQKYDVWPIAISPEGHWLNPSLSLEVLDSISELPGEPVPDTVAMIADPRFPGLSELGGDSGIDLDVVFPVLHGTFGEDGTIQGLLDLAGIPYVGCGVLASAAGMDKVVMKTLFRDADLPMCQYVWFLRSEWDQNKEEVARKVEARLGYPVFIKPANLGSSVGISKADNIQSLIAGIDIAAQYDRKIIVEEGLEMREIECAVVGNDNPKASLPGEYVIKDDEKKFLDYEEKYSGTGNNEFVVPALISRELTLKIQRMAVNAFRSIDGSGLARVDFFLKNDTGEVLINEINTMPGLTDASGFPKMWEGTGKSFVEVIDWLIDLALERHADRSRNQTTR